MTKIANINDLEKIVAQRWRQKSVRLDFEDKAPSDDSVRISDEAKRRLISSKVMANISKDVESK